VVNANITKAFQRLLISTIVFVQVFFYPVVVFAQETTETGSSPETTTESSVIASEPETTEPTTQQTETQSATVEPQTGPSQPTGSASSTYSYNPETGMWENGYYAWDPNTNQTQPLTPQNYSYNPSTGMWDTTEWIYSPEQGKYIPNVVSVASISSTGPGSTNAIQGGSGTQNLISNTGPNSNNTIDNNSSLTGTYDLFFNGAISNNISSTARSGDAIVQGNTLGGSALTGDAQVIANVLNMLQSSWLAQSPEIAGFIATLDGSHFGDLYLDPSSLPYTSGLPANVDLDINVDSNGVIDNDIDLVASSGNATVDSNTEAGDATTGDAYVMANIINMINSAIYANRSFFGIININGDLNGDILLPLGMLDQALIANTGPNSNNTITESCGEIEESCGIDVTTDTTRTINNTINADAESGDALVDGNTSAGSAQTGEAETNVNTMNFVGQNVTGKNALLVFVNVLGTWVGFFLSPTNSSISNTGPDSNNTITTDGQRNISVDATENSLINNDINVSANSGDASITNNTEAGNARSGDASANVNLLNMIDSQINVSDWFGVLFINVFGSWLGDFNNDTAAGEAPLATGGSGGGATVANAQQSTQSNGGAAQNTPVAAVFGFFGNNTSLQNEETTAQGTTAGASTPAQPNASTAPTASQASAKNGIDKSTLFITVSSLIAMAVAIFILLDRRYFLIDRYLAG
jgi:hypothetical protein